ncbi:hypothetical protein [Rock bream iridovirus]|uniref:Uncharacterized protein n=1 Tax=Rock bream iridovirus TaxID=263891 RepID=M1TCW9_ISKNV|nr:hypothetical protein [Rock bream iridovirus]
MSSLLLLLLLLLPALAHAGPRQPDADLCQFKHLMMRRGVSRRMLAERMYTIMHTCPNDRDEVTKVACDVIDGGFFHKALTSMGMDMAAECLHFRTRYCHTSPVLSNTLYSPQGMASAVFGLASHCPADLTTLMYYMCAPERHEHRVAMMTMFPYGRNIITAMCTNYRDIFRAQHTQSAAAACTVRARRPEEIAATSKPCYMDMCEPDDATFAYEACNTANDTEAYMYAGDRMIATIAPESCVGIQEGLAAQCRPNVPFTDWHREHFTDIDKVIYNGFKCFTVYDHNTLKRFGQINRQDISQMCMFGSNGTYAKLNFRHSSSDLTPCQEPVTISQCPDIYG